MALKKLINDPNNIVNEFIDGFLYTRPDLKRIGSLNCIVKANPTKDKVALVSLGGSGHEPAHAGYIGLNGLDGVACGNIFASPSVEQIYETAKAVNTGAGVLFIVKNYKGDNLNTDMAIELLKEDGISCKKLVVTDDVAPVEGMIQSQRRGVAGTILVHQILGAMARGYNNLDYLFDAGQQINLRLKTMGLALSPCTIPAVGEPNCDIPEGMVTLGIGIHGEKGVMDIPIESCESLADRLVSVILEDFEQSGLPIQKNDRLIVLVNGMGATPPVELYLVNKSVRDRLSSMEVSIMKNLVGNYMTSLEMAGCSITILKVEEGILPFTAFVG